MGVPAFFRWLSRKYPSIVVHGQEEQSRTLEDGTKVPVDTTAPNPNMVEFDNLYLDMNGIIHPCCHPEDRPAPRNEEEMMILIFEYIDRIFALVRPRRLLYMAIDGVAPRAKMNQQRSRRFRGSKEAAEKEEEIRIIRQRLKDEGLSTLVDKSKLEGTKFDNNCITPGTEFMANLANNLRYYIHDRLTNDPGWAKISVILSDSNVPGEGEHKIMDFIRKQRASPHHDPNTHHCLCGADADLIMLGLATHEANFTIIREEFKPNAPRPCPLCGQIGHELKYCNGLPTTSGQDDEEPPPPGATTEFIFLRLSVLREYLAKDLAPDRQLSFKFDLERAIDDWVFMCFFVGNDFLPHLPSLEIREGAIDRLIDIYKNNADRCGGYLTENGFVDYNRIQIILTELGKMEDGILRQRMQKAKIERRRDKERERNEKRRREDEDEQQGRNKRRRTDGPAFELDGPFQAQPVGQFGGPVLENARQAVHDARVGAFARGGQNPNMSAAQKLRAMLVSGGAPEGAAPTTGPAPLFPVPSPRPAPPGAGNGNNNNRPNDDDEKDPNDIVRLGEDGWKQRYYLNKFAVVVDEDVDFQRQLVRAYVEGLSWVLAYYYQGCPSWNWYYPYHYSPFASDFVGIASFDLTFPTDTKPFNPLEQLMAVFPAASGSFLPKEWRKLMSDPDSPILDFYPSDFCVDLNGKKFAWQGVALLPFVDEDRLLSTLRTVYPTLTGDEIARNTKGESLLFAGRTHTVTASLNETFYSTEMDVEKTSSLTWLELPADLIYGMAGLTALDVNCFWLNRPIPSPFTSLPSLECNAAVSVCYQDPYFPVEHRYQANRLPRAKSPPRVLDGRGAVVGFDPNRQRTNLNPGAHRMLNGAIRGSSSYNGGGGGYGGDRNQRGFYDQRNIHAGNHDGRRSYNEEREPPRRDGYHRDDGYNAGGRGSSGGYQPSQYGQQPYNYPQQQSGRYDDRRGGQNQSSRDQPRYSSGGGYSSGSGYSGYSGGGGYGSGGGGYHQETSRSGPSRYETHPPAGYQQQPPHYQNNSYLSRTLPPPQYGGQQPRGGQQQPPPPPPETSRYYTSNYRRSN